MKYSGLFVLSILGILCSFVACSDSLSTKDSSDAAITIDASLDASVDLTDSQTSDSQAPNRIIDPGMYASKQWLELRSVGIGGTTDATLTSWNLHQVGVGGDLQKVLTTTCKVEQTPSLGVNITFRDSFVTALPQTAGLLTEGSTGFHLSVPTYTVGATLADPLVDPLPTASNDPTVSDDDGDSKPGVTISLSGLLSSEVYIALKLTDELVGQTTQPDGSITGEVASQRQQSYLGTSNGAIAPFLPEMTRHPDPAKSVFVVIPWTQGSSCGELVANDSLFPAKP